MVQRSPAWSWRNLPSSRRIKERTVSEQYFNKIILQLKNKIILNKAVTLIEIIKSIENIKYQRIVTNAKDY